MFGSILRDARQCSTNKLVVLSYFECVIQLPEFRSICVLSVFDQLPAVHPGEAARECRRSSTSIPDIGPNSAGGV